MSRTSRAFVFPQLHDKRKNVCLSVIGAIHCCFFSWERAKTHAPTALLLPILLDSVEYTQHTHTTALIVLCLAHIGFPSPSWFVEYTGVIAQCIAPKCNRSLQMESLGYVRTSQVSLTRSIVLPFFFSFFKAKKNSGIVLE